MSKNPLLNGMLGPLTTAPFFANATTTQKQMQQAFKKYGKDLPIEVGSVEGWINGQVFAMAAKIGRKSAGTGKITSAQILNGLWKIKSNDLGGLTAPLTYNKNAANPQPTCWFATEIVNGHWSLPRLAKASCGQGSGT